jgi:DNA-binding HxlR family transcriptional regulator
VDQKLIYDANELQRSVKAMHATAFNAALRRLVDHDLVHHPNKGNGTHYTLASKGARVLPLLEAFVEDIRWW